MNDGTATAAPAESTPRLFRAALLRVHDAERESWVNAAFGLGDIPADGTDLPRGCVPYLPCPIDTLLRVVERAPVRASDVFVDLGSGVGRAAALVHLLTGARVVGVEIQADLVLAARHLVSRLRIARAAFIEGDAAQWPPGVRQAVNVGSVFFLYCPFGGERLNNVLAALERIARTRMICVCSVDLPLPPRPLAHARGGRAGQPDDLPQPPYPVSMAGRR